MQTDAKDQVYAGFFVRLTAFLIDMFLVNIALLFIRIPMWVMSMRNPGNIFTKDLIFQYSIAEIVIYLLTVTYFVLLTYYTGSTLGKKLFHLKVVSTEDRELTLFEVVYRESIGRFLSSVILQLGYLLILAQKEHRGVHDLLSDTSVIYYHEKKVYVHQQMNYRNMAPQPGYIVPPAAGTAAGPDTDARNTVGSWESREGSYGSPGQGAEASSHVTGQDQISEDTEHDVQVQSSEDKGNDVQIQSSEYTGNDVQDQISEDTEHDVQVQSSEDKGNDVQIQSPEDTDTDNI